MGTATDWAEIACGGEFSLALKSDGSLWAWGGNDNGQLGLGDYSVRHAPLVSAPPTTGRPSPVVALTVWP